MDLRAKLHRGCLILLLTASALLQSGCFLTRGYTQSKFSEEECEALAVQSIVDRGIDETCKKICCCLSACVTSDSADEFKAKFIEKVREKFSPEMASKVEARMHFVTEFGALNRMFKCQNQVFLEFSSEGGSPETRRKIEQMGLQTLLIRLESLNEDRDTSQTSHQDERNRLSYMIGRLIELIQKDIENATNDKPRNGTNDKPLKFTIKMPGCQAWQSGSSGGAATISPVEQQTVFTEVPVPSEQTAHKNSTTQDWHSTTEIEDTTGSGLDIETNGQGNKCMPRDCNWGAEKPTEKVDLDWTGIFP